MVLLIVENQLAQRPAAKAPSIAFSGIHLGISLAVSSTTIKACSKALNNLKITRRTIFVEVKDTNAFPSTQAFSAGYFKFSNVFSQRVNTPGKFSH
jgi:hypothetical protein